MNLNIRASHYKCGLRMSL